MIYRDYRTKKKEVVKRNTETMIHQHLEELVLEKERLKNEFQLVCEDGLICYYNSSCDKNFVSSLVEQTNVQVNIYSPLTSAWL